MKKIVLALLLALGLAQSGFADEVGYHPGGAPANNGSSSSPTCSRVTTTISLNITKITAYWVWLSDDTFYAAIYAIDGGGRPTGAALATSAVSGTVTADGWKDSGAISYTMAASTSYGICVWTSSAITIRSGYDTPGVGTNQASVTLSGTYPTWPTWTDDFPLDRQYLIYATGTAAGGSSPAPSNMLMGVGQ